MPERYAAFVSYARRYRPWVEVLQKNLELCLQVAGRPGKVFLDATNLGSGSSWIGQVQAELAKSDQFVLVATPEALASPRVKDELESFVHRNDGWRCLLHVVLLVETPLPPFLGPIHYLDFRTADAESYRRGLRKLVAGLLGRPEAWERLSLPETLELPKPVDPGLPPALRKRLVDWLAVPLKERELQAAVADCLGLKSADLKGHPSPECAASAALVLALGEEDPVTAAFPIVDRLAEEFAARTAWLATLELIRADLLALRSRPVVNALLKLWLNQVAEDHAQLTPHFQQREPELDLLQRVYVELQLSPEIKRSAEPAALTTPKELHEILRLDPDAEPWVTRRWAVLGDPGAGKTTLLRHFAASLAREESPAWVPLFDSLPRLLRESEFVLAAAGRRMDRLGHRGAQLIALLDRLGQEGRLVLLLDGLDEVPREKISEAEQLLRGLAVRWPATPLVVASRPIGYRRPGSDFRELTLLPLDRERRLEFLARWLGRATGTRDGAAAERALAVLDRPELRELAENPLYLTLMALLLEHGSEPNRNRTLLYDQVFTFLLDGKHHWPEGEPFEAQTAVRAILRHLAYGMTEDDHSAEPVTALEERLYQPAVAVLRRALAAQWGKLRKFLDELSQRTGILGPHDGEGTDWRFWHRTFREALAAERLTEDFRGKNGRAALLARARKITAEEDLSRWAEPFALLAGRVDDPDGLVRALIQTNRPLGLRALATAQNLRDETVREVLALTEDWEQRRKVYERVPELVGEPGRALRLLDQLRRRTRNGNDLFFLDQAVQEVGRRSPEQAREAAELQARLYNHIPAPPEELFRWIDTPLDGNVELWRKIPAGRFWMGSPDGQGDEDEHPLHEITVDCTFHFAAVPVTKIQYAAFDPEHQSKISADVPAVELTLHPVTDVTWYEAISFCRWLSTVFDWTRGARLPVEEEWEYACRAGTQGRYWSGDKEEDLARVGWYCSNSGARTHRVGEKPANPWGLYDVHGNVWEWTLSPWRRNYKGRKGGMSHDPSTVEVDPVADGAPGGVKRVFRGGCYWYVADRARAACRNHWYPKDEDLLQGFRVVIPRPAPSSLRVDHQILEGVLKPARPAGSDSGVPFLAAGETPGTSPLGPAALGADEGSCKPLP